MKKMFKRWNEYLPFAIALLAWWFSSIITRWLDPQAGVDDAGLIQAMAFGAVLYYGACAMSWFGLRLIFPRIGAWVDDDLGLYFESELRENRIWVALVLFAIYFFGAIAIMCNVV